MFVMHVALQGCLRGNNVEYGLTADTGGHIRYLLDLVAASAVDPRIDRVDIVTRGFTDMDKSYASDERIDAKTRIVRLSGVAAAYLPKEQLWREYDHLAAALAAHLRTLDRLPDILHAHYADGGEIARRVGADFDIPFVFTAHSLGRVKREACAGSACHADLDRRIATEERVIDAAAGIVASSRDEAEIQYRDYAAYRPGQIRIIEPGSNLAAFAAATGDPMVDARLARFLADPAKPPILAIARPVTKKNLTALVHAFGRSPVLRARANLILIAGIRDDLASLEPEIAANIAELLALIDHYDLYGSVAYPKYHAPAEIPAIYAHCASRRGVFVNPALHEPFGLTLLEAAAAGIPVVATDSGGPNDIVERCKNGHLVDPLDPDAIAQAVGALLDDAANWDRCSAAGVAAVSDYDWPRHAAMYHDFIEAILGRRAPAAIKTAGDAAMLVCDIDNTLIGSRACTDRFKLWHRAQRDVVLGIATGRSLHSAQAILTRENVPVPRFMITSVGSEIYYLDDRGTGYVADAEWEATIAMGWDRDAVVALIERDGGLTPQSPLEQRRFKLSYFTRGEADAATRIRDLLRAAGLSCSVIQSHGTYLDILPHAASKGTAVEHVRRRYGFGRDQVIVAGDSGNDVEMLRSFDQAIIVANHSDGLAQHPALGHGFVSRFGHARGVIDGVQHFRRLARSGKA